MPNKRNRAEISIKFDAWLDHRREHEKQVEKVSELLSKWGTYTDESEKYEKLFIEEALKLMDLLMEEDDLFEAFIRGV